MTTLVADPTATRRRIDRLRRYTDAEVLNGRRFVCASYRACRNSISPSLEFHEGVLPHVGQHYDVVRDGRPLRIVVVGQEYGFRATLPQRRITLEKRYEIVMNGAGLGRRYLASRGFSGRSPHMRGTTSALRILLGNGIGADWEGEFVRTVEGSAFHVFDAFALVNALLCSARPPQSSEGRSSSTMRANCLRHFKTTLRILAPTIIILQGEGVTNWTESVFRDVRPASRRSDPHLVSARLGRREALVCRFSHPSSRGSTRWGDRLDSPYLVEVVEPTLKQALRLMR